MKSLCTSHYCKSINDRFSPFCHKAIQKFQNQNLCPRNPHYKLPPLFYLFQTIWQRNAQPRRQTHLSLTYLKYKTPKKIKQLDREMNANTLILFPSSRQKFLTWNKTPFTFNTPNLLCITPKTHLPAGDQPFYKLTSRLKRPATQYRG